MRFHMQPVTVAIADTDRDRRAGYERLLQDEFGIALLTDAKSGSEDGRFRAFVNRRFNSRKSVEAYENEVARIKRLKPLIVLVNVNLYIDEDCALLLSLRRECPDALMILLTDDSTHENQIMQALEIGARGYLKYNTVRLHLSMAIQVVGCGEGWVPRKMLGSIMDRMLH